MILGMTISTILDAKNACLKFREMTNSNILITLDCDGCIFLESGSTNPIHYPTKDANLVDATGAGDIFRATFVSTYIKTKNIEDSIYRALDLATKSVEIKGVDNTIKQLFK